MAATAKNYNTNMVELGPGDVWLMVGLPSTGSRLTLAADGTPDSVGSPSAQHLGMTLDGARVIYEPNIQNYESDEQTSPIISQISGEAVRIEGQMLQILDTLVLANLIAGGTRSAGAGYEQLLLGGKQTLATFTVLFVAPIFADPTKFFAVQLYKAYNAAGFAAQVSRKAMSASPFNFVGLSISSRPAGDQTGIIWKTI